MSDEKHHQTSDIKKPAALKGELCRHCGGGALWPDTLVDGAHPLCQALRPLEELLDATDDPSIEDETDRYRKTVHALLTLWERLPRGEQEKTLRFLTCELAEVNPMYAMVCLDEDDSDGALAAMRENGLDPVVTDILDGTACIDIHSVSALRQDEFFDWLTGIVVPFGGFVHEAGYGDPADRGPPTNRRWEPVLVT